MAGPDQVGQRLEVPLLAGQANQLVTAPVLCEEGGERDLHVHMVIGGEAVGDDRQGGAVGPEVTVEAVPQRRRLGARDARVIPSMNAWNSWPSRAMSSPPRWESMGSASMSGGYPSLTGRNLHAGRSAGGMAVTAHRWSTIPTGNLVAIGMT
jgi:hypothetical protein